MTDRDELEELQLRALEAMYQRPPLTEKQNDQEQRLQDALYNPNLTDGERSSLIYEIICEE